MSWNFRTKVYTTLQKAHFAVNINRTEKLSLIDRIKFAFMTAKKYVSVLPKKDLLETTKRKSTKHVKHSENFN